MTTLGSVRTAARNLERARQRAADAEAKLGESIRGAVADGHAAAAIAAAAGISRARVYQIRDGRR